MTFCPVSSGAPTVRGLHLMNEVFRFLPIKSDYVWGPLFFVPAVTQLTLLTLGVMRFRARLATFQAMMFAFMTLLLAMVNIGTTGIGPYSMLAIGNLFVMAQLIQQKHGLYE